ncbi:MAG: TRAP transporter small permease protein, partial [Rhizobiales bacterium 32-66-8]
VLYYAVLAGFVMMLVRSVQVGVGNLRRGYSVLERPDAFETTEA